MSGPVLLLAALAGGLLAALHLGLLWASLRRMPAGGRSGGWLLAGSLARLALVVAGFWLVSGGQAASLVAALAGFLVVRTVWLGVVRARLRRDAPTAPAGGTAP